MLLGGDQALCVTTCFAKDRMKLEISLTYGTASAELWNKQMKADLVQARSLPTPGVAPRGNLEREIQGILDAMRIAEEAA